MLANTLIASIYETLFRRTWAQGIAPKSPQYHSHLYLTVAVRPTLTCLNTLTPLLPTTTLPPQNPNPHHPRIDIKNCPYKHPHRIPRTKVPELPTPISLPPSGPNSWARGASTPEPCFLGHDERYQRYKSGRSPSG